MWIVLIFTICLAITNATNASIEEFTGEWTPVALYPAITYIPVCLRVSYSKNPTKAKCSCADGKDTEFMESRRIVDDNIAEGEKIPFPMLVVEDVNEVTALLNVTCTCGGTEFPSRVVAKSVNKDYIVLYRVQTVFKKEPNAALLYARKVPSYSELIAFMKTIPGLSERDGEVMCTTEYEYAEILKKKVVSQEEENVKTLII